MNKIYKVIWSKAKHTYVVASEIAKGHTKGETTGKGLKRLAAAMLVAAALMGPNFAWAADTTKVEPAPDGSAAVEVYTKDGADKAIATSINTATIINTNTKAINTNATNISINTANIKSNTEKISKLESAVGDSKTAIDTEKTAREAGDKALDDRITNVKEYVLSETNKNYVSKTDAAVQDGAIVKAANTIGDNVTNLDAALAKETAARIGADKAQDAVIQQVNQNAANGIATLATAYNNEVASREAADNELNERITNEANAIHKTTNQLQKDLNTETAAREAGDKALDDRITNVKEYVLSETNKNYVSKTDAAVQDGAIVKAANTIGDNVTNLDAALAKETAARIGADKAQDAVIQQVNQNAANGIATLATAYNNEVASREAADNELNERITNEANAIHDTTNKLQDDLNTETVAREAGDTALDTRITNVKEYLEKQTSDKYVSKADAAVQDGAIVKAANTIGENVTNLDAALAKETAARLGADKAQDKVIEQVNQNMVDGFNTINKNMSDGFTALSQADANELAGRMAADTKLVEAVNSGVSLSNDNVLQKNTTTIDAQGNVTTSKTDANEMILNKGNKNQITLNEKGVKVGTNSSVMDADGIYTGGDTFDAAKAAMSSDGQIKGANGKFTVDASGNTTVTSLDAGTGTIQTKGDIYAKDATFSGDITAKDATLSGDLSAKDGTFSGDLSAKDGTFSGDVSAKDVTATGTLQGAEVTDGTATLKQGKLTGVKDIETEALHVNGDANVTGKLTTKDLEVTGEFNANTLKSRLDENNYTEIHGGNVTSKNLKVDKGVTRTSESSFDENGREEYVTDNDSRATVKVGANEISQTLDDKGDNPKNAASRVLSQNTDNKYEITDSVVEGNQSNVENRTADTTDSQISFKDDSGKVLNKSYITQNLKKVLMGVEEGDNKTTIEQNANNITNTAKNGTITNDAKDLVNTATGDMTNTVGGKLLNDVTGDMENKVGGNLSTTVGGSQTTTVTGDSSLTAENINNTARNKITNKALDVETDAASSIVSKVSNDYGSNTSTQLSYQTTEEMSQADGKTASYLRGAAEEKSQLIDGSKKTTIDTIAGQTNTNITDGTNTSNDLQKADQIASSVTDGTNTTVVNQDAGSLASSITDGTKVNNTNNTVNKSEQLIKADDTHFYAETRTAEKAEEALKSGNTLIDIVKDTKTATVSSAVTDGATITGISQNAKDISLSAAGGTITNDAKTLLNKASESITDKVGDNVERTMTTKKISESVKDGTKSNTFTKTYDKDINVVTDGTNTSTESQLADSVNTSLKNGTQSLNNTKTVTEDVTKVTDKNTGAFSSSSQKADSITSTVKDTEKGTISERSQTVFQVQDKVGTTTVTTTDGLTKLTNEAGTHKTQMDFAEVLKDLGVRGNATVDKKLTVKGDSDLQGNATVGKDLAVKGNTKLDGTLEVVGKSTFKDDVTMEKNLDVKGTTTTDTLKVTGSSEFDGKATFNDIVTMNKGLSVTGGVTADTVTADSYKVGDKTYIDKDGINANNQVIRNVGQGNISEGSTDAVSGGQLYETNTRVSGLETRMGTVETRVDKLDNKIDKVGANAAAMANLHPLEFDEDSKWNIAAAVGSSGSETASAVGVFYRPNENVMVNASAAMGTGENMFGGGVSLRLGHGGNKAKDAQMKAAAAENKELRAKVDDLTARMDALLSVLNPNMSKDFPDVPENHWAYEAVSRLAGNGIVEGYEDGKYHGERQMTRYEMAEIIYNALSKGAKAEKKLVEEFRPELQAMAAQKKA
ncbi:MAG TPA: ESPR-type extended signal peptide-containing protein [Veillonellaceae bacterium]|nr:ESPR-type extended signal peptide-containing protein [Veillonellaceae bacterium]